MNNHIVITIQLLVAISFLSEKLLGQPSLKVGDPAPTLSIQEWLKGSPVTTFEKGRIYVLEFGATHCAPCRQVAPHLTELSNKYKDKATFIGIHIWENNKNSPEDLSYLKNVHEYLDIMGEKIGFSIAVDVPEQITAEAWMNASENNSIPTTFIVDGSGNVAWIGSPFSIEPILEKIMNGEHNYDAKIGEKGDNIQKKKSKTLEIGDPAPPLPSLTWFKCESTSLEQLKEDSSKVLVLAITNGRTEMFDRKSIHIMTRVAKEYAGKVQVLWIYSGISKKLMEVKKFIEELGDKIGYCVAGDTPENEVFMNWNLASRNINITAYIIDQNHQLIWMGSPSEVETALKNVLAGGGIENSRRLNEITKRVFHLRNQIIKEWTEGYKKDSQKRMDSLIAANPEIQDLYCTKYLYFMSHDESPDGKERAESWLYWMLQNMPKNYFYWEYVANDALHAIRSHGHTYYDLLISILDRVIEESETKETAARFLMLKAQIYAALKKEKDPNSGAEIIDEFLDKNKVYLDTLTIASLISDYYLYKIQYYTFNNQPVNPILKEILKDEHKGVKFSSTINYLLNQKSKFKYDLLLKVALRNVNETAYLSRKASRFIHPHLEAIVLLAKVYNLGGEEIKAYENFEKAWKLSEQTKNAKAIERYKNLLTEFQTKTSGKFK